MDQNFVLNGNKLIAEFYGEYYNKERLIFKVFNNYNGTGYYGLEDMLFHNSWDWLMPVVEKIESIYDDFHGYFAVHIVSNGCTISGTKLRPGVVNAYFDQEYADSKLKATYECVVKFIKWYNENKSK